MARLDWGPGFLKRLPYSGSPMTEEEKLVAGKQAGQRSAVKNGFVPERKAESVPHTDASRTDVYAVHGADHIGGNGRAGGENLLEVRDFFAAIRAVFLQIANHRNLHKRGSGLLIANHI